MEDVKRSLEMDVKELLRDIIEKDFHDFESTRYATPKLALVRRLQQLIDNTKSGRYDDKMVKQQRRS